MKKLIVFVVLSLVASLGYARDFIADYTVADALNLEQAKTALGNDVKFFFGEQFHGKVRTNFGEFKTSKKTNAFNKTDQTACQWAFLSAMVTLRERAIREGGNAVINIRSNYRNQSTTSDSTFQCGAGAFVTAVALVGTVVRID